MARYEYQQGIVAFPVPFEYEKAEHIGVNLEYPTGQERRLTLNVDYVVDSGAVIYVLPKNHALIIFEDAPPAIQKFQAQTLASIKRAPVQQAAAIATFADSAPVEQVTETISQAAAVQSDTAIHTDPRLSALEAKIAALEDERLRLLELERAKTADAQIEALEESGASTLAAIEDTANQALTQIQVVSANATRQTLESVAQAASAADDAATRANEAALTLEQSTDNAEAKAAALLEDLQARLTALEAKQEQTAQASIRQIDMAAMNAIASLNEQAASIAVTNEANARLDGSPWPLEGFFTVNQNLAARSVVTLPNGVAYYPGRNSLIISVNGYTLIQGRDYEEICDGTHPSNTIRILLSSLKGDLWHFYVLPTNTAQAAQEAAGRAETSEYNAGVSADKAQTAQAKTQELADKTITEGTANLNAITSQGNQAVRNIAITRDNAKEEIAALALTARRDSVSVWQEATIQIRKEAETSSQAARQLWQDAERSINGVRQDAQQKAEAASATASKQAGLAEMNADKALELAQCAWQAAFDASVVNAKPGIASVNSFKDLLSVVSGVYIINPHVRSKTPFMGVWPVEKLEDMKWDGFFFINIPYPEQPAPPDPDLPPYPENPAEVSDMQPIAAGKEWLPCDHTHN